ncbi:Serine/threonine-protein_phosphatase 2A activator [Hexamita inflata]|uniref:Serine/threonine-protein phosphatase 2A activator n=1 Tax=Hexamita inflata TaxID=28002 RepID=A0AA86PYX6_9EUKA|nr:Serine/threonine-protein phosphatase 2A activator [Hexamita inflata]
MFAPPTTFVDPQKLIINDRQLFNNFKYSKAYFFISGFVDQLNTLMKGKKFSDCPAPSEAIQQISNILTEVRQIFDNTPPVARDCRYGNPSFKTFIEKLTAVTDSLHANILSTTPEAIIELRAYFLDSFGSYGRLDYGTGHELNFICYLVCLLRLQILGTMDDLLCIGLSIFPQYVNLVIDLQNIYTLEPAGSHGAWSVDDYNLLPFVFGSAQFVNEKDVKIIFSRDQAANLKNTNLYMRMISNINDVKSHELYTNSPFISEIHMKPDMNWEKINNGMLKHFNAEVLGKWPVIQHFWFGNILGFK